MTKTDRRVCMGHSKECGKVYVNLEFLEEEESQILF